MNPRRRVRFVGVLVALALLLVACGSSSSTSDGDGGAQTPSTTGAESSTEESRTGDGADVRAEEAWDGTFTYSGTAQAPDFPTGLDWLNVDRPLSLAQDLRGKIVLLDFWTQGCINCIHVIPDLKRLEAEYADELVVVGVHWAKFDRERNTEAIRQSVIRYGVEHPIVNDQFEQIRRTYGVQAWPTLVLLDPEGKGVGAHSGEGIYEVFQPVIDVMAREFDAAGLINDEQLSLVLERQAAAPTVLSFPGKVLADEATDQLFVADSGHHRILVSDLDGELAAAIGSGIEGFGDGSFETAMFSRPQGMALSADGSTLYIADRENHAIRAADLRTRTVTTIGGTGSPTFRFVPGPAMSTDIASPWDLHLEDDQLYIAGAGRHQLWVLDLTASTLDVFAGTGAEGLVDGPRLETTLSQPSGFAAAGDVLYFTDPEASAIRQVELSDGGELTTLVGDGLFTWGDEDGDFDSARLQHAIGIEELGGDLYIADTYNHRIKVVDLDGRTVETVAGSGSPGFTDGADAAFAEPSGLSEARGVLYIADTNNHQLRLLDPATGEVSTLAFSNLDVAVLTQSGLSGDQVALAPQKVAAGEIELHFDYLVPDGYKFNEAGTFTFEWVSSDESVVSPVGASTYAAMGPDVPLTFRATAHEGSATVTARSTVFYCLTDEEAFCLIRDVEIEIPIEVGPSGATTIEVEHALPSAEQIEQRAF